MKAVRFYEYGGPEVLKVEDIDLPEPGLGQIRIAVKAAGINPIDWKLRAGYMREMMPLELPAGVGYDAAGVVDSVGKDRLMIDRRRRHDVRPAIHRLTPG